MARFVVGSFVGSARSWFVCVLCPVFELCFLRLVLFLMVLFFIDALLKRLWCRAALLFFINYPSIDWRFFYVSVCVREEDGNEKDKRGIKERKISGVDQRRQ